MLRFLLALFPVCLLATPPVLAQQEQTQLAFSHVTVIDCTGVPAKLDMTVVVTGDRITGLGKSDSVHLTKEVRVIDCSGKYMIPGLWDMHVHLDDYSLPLYIANGVTGVRVMGGDRGLELRKGVECGALLGPHIHQASQILDGPRGRSRGFDVITSVDEARFAVRRYASEGRDFLKVYSNLSREAYLGIVDEAKKRKTPFAGHVPNSVSAIEASDLGQKSIEHLNGVAIACSPLEEELREELVRGIPFPAIQRKAFASKDGKLAEYLFQRFVRNNTWQVPTLTVLRWQIVAASDRSRYKPLLKYVSHSRLKSWENRRRRISRDADDDKILFQHYVDLVRDMRLVGVEFLAGTDAGNPYCMPGFGLHDELELLVACGFSRMQALQAATLNPAKYLGRTSDLGTISQGKLADLVLLDANPLDQIENTRKIHAVYYQGKLIDRATLDSTLRAVEKLVSAEREIETKRLQLTDEEFAQLAIGFAASGNINLANSQIGDNGLGALARHSTARTLNLKGTAITDAGLVHVSRLSRLYVLNLSDTDIVGRGLEHVATLRSLQTLTLDGTKITDASLAYLADMESLKQLNLRRTRISGKGLRHLSKARNLTVMYAAESMITDEGLAAISEIPTIERLGLSRTKITDNGLAQLTRIEHLKGLGLANADVTDRGARHLAGLKELDFLDLAGNQLTDESMKYLGELNQLRYLELRDNQITGRGLAHIARLRNLRTLSLMQTEVSDSELAHLKSLPKLQVLSLNGTNVTSKGILQLKELSSLISVNVTECKISEEEIVQLRKSVSFQIIGP